MTQLIDRLEHRRLMSYTLIDEPVGEIAGATATVRIAYLPTLTVGHLSQISGNIGWGDGTVSPATFQYDTHGGTDVLGTHAYVNSGTFAISSVITQRPYPSGVAIPQYIILVGEIDTTATVSAATKLTETVNQKFTATLGSFATTDSNATFTAKVRWGDGNFAAGKISSTGDITASHTYRKAGTYTVHTLIYSHVKGSHKTPQLVEDLVTSVVVNTKTK